jgi:hypothetical protein
MASPPSYSHDRWSVPLGCELMGILWYGSWFLAASDTPTDRLYRLPGPPDAR